VVLAKGSTPQYGRRLLRCRISTQLMTAQGHDRSFGDVGSMSGLRESGHGRAIYEYISYALREIRR
jgi:hypothetical protein